MKNDEYEWKRIKKLSILTNNNKKAETSYLTVFKKQTKKILSDIKTKCNFW